jgi:hypothetical protein
MYEGGKEGEVVTIGNPQMWRSVNLTLISTVYILPLFTSRDMADDFDAAASWLSSNPAAASLPNDTKLEVSLS